MIRTHIFDNPFPLLIQELFKKEYNYEGSLDNLHSLFETTLITPLDIDYHRHIHPWSNDRDSIFVKKFHSYVDNCPDFNETYYAFIQKHIKPLFPDETKLVVQKTPNIRFSFPDSAAIGCDPNDPENIIGLHCDSNFGHNENEMNFIVPVTRMYASNSIYYEPTIDSKKDPFEYENVVLNTYQFFEGYFNKLKHCNRINQTNKTRISFDIRVIPYNIYMDNLEFFQGTKFEIGKYYIVL